MTALTRRGRRPASTQPSSWLGVGPYIQRCLSPIPSLPLLNAVTASTTQRKGASTGWDIAAEGQLGKRRPNTESAKERSLVTYPTSSL
jgi:hypothetical protein